SKRDWSSDVCSSDLEPFVSQITSPFVQLTSGMTNFPSVAKKLNSFNYKTTAIHPYIPSFYRRNDVYSNLGFDEFRHQDNMKNKRSEERRVGKEGNNR